MKKSLLFLGFCLAALVILPNVSAQTDQESTPSELSKYNGQNGAKAYVAVNGVVYDVSKVASWPLGKHLCPGAVAGKDISNLWSLVPKSHRKADFLARFPKVGKLVAGPKVSPAPKTPLRKIPQNTKVVKKMPTPVKPYNYFWLGLAVVGLGGLIWLMLRLRRK